MTDQNKKKKRPGFGEKAKDQLSGGVSMKALLSGDDPEDLEENRPNESVSSEFGKSAKPQNRKAEIEQQVVKIEHSERHFFYFTEKLTDTIDYFMLRVRPKEKNKNRFMRVLLNDFFSKSQEQQEKIYGAALKKFKDIV
ncbi:MAG: hypothetical protein GY710_26585 [Desulfobacteraceae bacterium]|nr:hypothetical protein [Desulfobacteraceae bacterium]